MERKKLDRVQIVNISSFLGAVPPSIHIYGLGDDGKMYYWSYDIGAWIANWQEEDKPKKNKIKRTIQ